MLQDESVHQQLDSILFNGLDDLDRNVINYYINHPKNQIGSRELWGGGNGVSVSCHDLFSLQGHEFLSDGIINKFKKQFDVLTRNEGQYMLFPTQFITKYKENCSYNDVKNYTRNKLPDGKTIFVKWKE